MKQDLRKQTIKYLKGVGEYRANLFQEQGIESINDLLEFFPKDYLEQSLNVVINEDQLNTLISFIGNIAEVKEKMTSTGTRQFIVTVDVNEVFVDLIWFRYGKWMSRSFQSGGRLWVSGILTDFNGRYQVIHPQLEVLNERENLHDFWKKRSVLPVYPAVGNISQTLMRNLIYSIFANYHQYIEETLPEHIIQKYKYDDRKTALQKVHFNTNPKNINTL
ncbi:MAG TPA: DNA helicase RecG, partial [Candidatus Cloacimonadota bacterium]|nr:DNA helicase RecG [Candidatus Cloacimonadota bacterium]